MRMSSMEKLHLRALLLANLELRSKVELCRIIGISRFNLWRFLVMKRSHVDYSLVVMLEDMLPTAFRNLRIKPAPVTEGTLEHFIRTGELKHARRQQGHHRGNTRG